MNRKTKEEREQAVRVQLATLLRSGEPISAELREQIACILEGTKRKRGRPRRDDAAWEKHVKRVHRLAWAIRTKQAEEYNQGRRPTLKPAIESVAEQERLSVERVRALWDEVPRLRSRISLFVPSVRYVAELLAPENSSRK